MKNHVQQKQARLTRWLLRLFGYDGLLPGLVFLIPAAFRVVLPQAPWVEFFALVLPIAAYLVRARIGLKMIEINRCKLWLLRIQKTSLFVALLFLLIFDAVAILLCTLPKGGFTPGDYAILALVYLLYLVHMAVASFPCVDASAV